jgi:hypothetical protein
MFRWRKSSFSGAQGECVELAHLGAVRDSKNRRAVIQVDLKALVGSVKAGRFDR